MEEELFDAFDSGYKWGGGGDIYDFGGLGAGFGVRDCGVEEWAFLDSLGWGVC